MTGHYAYLCIGCPLGCRLELDVDDAGAFEEEDDHADEPAVRGEQRDHTDEEVAPKGLDLLGKLLDQFAAGGL
ncbi:MAG TPA: hypothetical protein PLV13_09630, partial [Ilumatobacteraceae bacterium]|nr:hypothetical protein [Ilumatobacteraceae bacterium]